MKPCLCCIVYLHFLEKVELSTEIRYYGKEENDREVNPGLQTLVGSSTIIEHNIGALGH